MEKVTILFVDDDEDDYYLFRDYLKDVPDKRFDIHWAKTFEEGFQQINELAPDICLFDFLLGEKTGLNLLRKVRESGNDTPIIMLTGKGDFGIDREAMALGATDYFDKSEMTPVSIERSIRYAISHAAALREVRGREHRLQVFFDQAKALIYVIDAQTNKFSEANKYGLDLFGYTREEFCNVISLRDLLIDKNDADKMLGLLAINGVFYDFGSEMLSKDGRKISCLVSVTVAKDVDGRTFYQGTLYDITQLRMAEQSKILAEKLAATGRFTRALVHEVRNPLTNINLSVEQIESENENEELVPYLEIIKRNSGRIGTLATELLLMSNPHQLHLKYVHLNDIAEFAWEGANDRLTLKNIKSIKKYAVDNPLLQVDLAKLQMALLNIILNAAEAMKEDEGILELITEHDEREFRITVVDNGVGIDAQKKELLFEPYFTGKVGGLGLGLATSLNIVQSHKGQILVQSELSKGSKFSIVLPAGKLMEEEE